jgi:hypothetical protein
LTHPQLPPAWSAYAEAARALGARLTAAALGPGRSSARLDDLARRLHREADALMETAFASLPDDDEGIACAPGCDHCCRTLPVSTLPFEVFAVVHRLRDARDADPVLDGRLTALAGTLPAAAPAPGSLKPCPMLAAGGLCLVYSTRPLACRGCMSADASACAACDESVLVPRSTVHQLGAASVAKGAGDALEALGFARGHVELRAGLALALREPDAEKRWLRGKDVFATLRPASA